MGKGGGNGGGKGKGKGDGSGGGMGRSRDADPSAKVWRPGDKDNDKGMGHEEVNAYDLFEEEPLPDVTGHSFNYAKSSTYDVLKEAVATQIAQMRELLRNHEAKEKEREWKRGLADGELDDARLVEAACGDQNVFRRRADSKNPALLASKPKRILIACDLSKSMLVLDRVDDRLRRLQEALVFIFESLSGFSQKYDFMISGYSSGGYDHVFVPWGRPPRTSMQRLSVLEKMVQHTHSCPPGDGTLSATEWAIQEVRKREADEYFVFIISDAELQRYSIAPEEWNKLLMVDPLVNAYAIIISMSSNETQMFLDGIDAGHGFACEQQNELAGIFKKVFSETLTKEAA